MDEVEYILWRNEGENEWRLQINGYTAEFDGSFTGGMARIELDHLANG